MVVAAMSDAPAQDPTALTSRQFRARRGGHGTGFFVAPTQWPYRIGHAGEHVPGFDPDASLARSVDHIGERRAQMSYQHITLFPNFSIYAGVDTARIWHPRGPGEIEVWAFGLVDKCASAEEREQARLATLRTFSPAGTWEQDDGENWVEIQRVLRGHEARQTPLNAQMGRATPDARDPDFPGAIASAYAEEAARGFYAHWQRMLLDADGLDSCREAYREAAE
jgi:benzene/toluene dioxygenase alpha subunit/biphenyl 2,3-dioxygenase alpha subunit